MSYGFKLDSLITRSFRWCYVTIFKIGVKILVHIIGWNFIFISEEKMQNLVIRTVEESKLALLYEIE